MDKTDDRLTLVDTQADKQLALRIVAIALVAIGLWMLWEGEWIILPVTLAGAAAVIYYAKRSKMQSLIVFDRPRNSVTLTVDDRKGRQTWDWALSDVETAELSRRYNDLSDTGPSTANDRPDLVLKDGTRVPMRPYHAAGSQSWNAVAAVKLFLGQDLDDAPTGWIPPEEFDRLFSEELARHHR
ncbi:hypothetical protein [Pseudooceanicola sp. MF1-13]|uniref:hypothetical protein n=1 Tax=Pseudooceanicola sp. MF1-13 TaxID=3379095 RepID=UPI0038911F21